MSSVGKLPRDDSLASALSGWTDVLYRQKGLAEILAEEKQNLEMAGGKLRLFDLLCIGIGTTVGSGVLILSGQVLSIAGPAATLGWLIAGGICFLTALSYIELCTIIPTSGSCYVYGFHTLGEFVGVIGALCLTLEYGVAGAGVSRNWSSIIAHMGGWSEYMFLWYPGADKTNPDSDMYIDVVAGAMMAICVAIVSSGLNFSKMVVNAFTVMKLIFVAFLIIASFFAWRTNVFSSADVFFAKGMPGLFRGASALFFGFVGFDEVCCLAGRTENPRRTMPRALAGTLLAATLLSMLAQFSIAGSASATEVVSWTTVFEGKGWHWAVVLTTVGELVLLPLIVLLSFLPQPELLAAMANDGLIPSLFNAIGGNGAFVWGSNISGVFMVLIAVFVPFSIIWDVISLGVLISFNITNTSLIMMRYGNGGATKQPAVGRLLGAFWIGGGIGAYTLWKCMVVPMLDGKSPSADAWKITAMGIVTLGMALVILCVIYFCFHAEQSATNSFRAPAVPFLPGLAIILNFFMMATIDWWSQLACLAYLAACLLPYLIFRGISVPAQKQETSQVSTV